MGKEQDMGTETNDSLAQMRPWSDLPPELLFCIANRLTSFYELLSFRRTCKNFRPASAGIKPCKDPWLLFHKTDSPECQIYDQHGSKIFTQNIPDLEGAVCLASYLGWLLVFKQESVFFFSPFSLSKISLPDFPHQQIDGHVAAFSDVPTSPHCIVSTFNRNYGTSLEVNIISKLQSTWTRHTLSRGHNPVLPGYYTKRMFHDMIMEKRDQFELEEDEYVSVCGLTYKDDKSRRVVYQNEVVDVTPTKTRMRRAVWTRFYEADFNLHW